MEAPNERVWRKGARLAIHFPQSDRRWSPKFAFLLVSYRSRAQSFVVQVPPALFVIRRVLPSEVTRTARSPCTRRAILATGSALLFHLVIGVLAPFDAPVRQWRLPEGDEGCGGGRGRAAREGKVGPRRQGCRGAPLGIELRPQPLTFPGAEIHGVEYRACQFRFLHAGRR